MPPTVLTIANQCSPDKIAPSFLPVIRDAIAIYQTIFDNSVLDIRLMGSVPRGEASCHSDIDFIAVLSANPNAEQLGRLESGESTLRQKHPLIPKIDLEAVPAESLGEFRRFVFATDSLSVFGIDSYSVPTLTIDRQKLAQMVTPDLAGIKASYRSAIEKADPADKQLLSFYSRLIGKDILKCLRRIALLRGGEYERNITGIYYQLLQYLPERKELLHELFDLYFNPVSDRQRLLNALREVETANKINPDL